VYPVLKSKSGADPGKKRRRRSRVGEGSSNITMKLKYTIIIPFIV